MKENKENTPCVCTYEYCIPGTYDTALRSILVRTKHLVRNMMTEKKNKKKNEEKHTNTHT